MSEVELLKNSFENALKIGQNVVIPKPDDVVPAFFKSRCALVVRGGAFAMLPAIDFNHQFSVQSDEVDYKSRKRDLPFEFYAIELTRAKSRPEQALGFGGISAEPAGVPSHRLSPLTLPSPQRGEGHSK